jgi:GNAT superfamily N-acetyltransferase
MKIIRTNSGNKDFISLVKELDVYLAEKDGAEHPFYAQYNKLDSIKHVVLAYENSQAVSCGAIKEFTPGVMEVKRMYTLPSARGKGHAGVVLAELEKWAAELGGTKCILETGKKQTEAIQFYHKNHYRPIPNYGQYAGVENSLCFEKILT